MHCVGPALLSATIYSSVAGNFLLHTVEMETPKFRVGYLGLEDRESLN